LSKIKIVIADDHREFRQLLVRLLSREFEVLDSVEHGMELIGSAIVLNPDVIVSDICMPRLSGPEAMNELNMRGLHIPFVFISASKDAMGTETSFVPKEDILKKLVPAIYGAASGQPYSSFAVSGEQHGLGHSVDTY
jgi:CheY-like chemotaxis protein